MTIKELYHYEREIGKVTVSTEKPDCDFVLRFRLIADEEMLLTIDGENFTSCVDVESTEGWYEVNAKDFSTSTNTASEADYIAALESLGVSFNG